LRLSLKVKAAAAITLLFLGVMALTASVQTRFIRDDLVAEVTDQQSELVGRAAKDLDQKLETDLLSLTGEALAIPPQVLAHPEGFRQVRARTTGGGWSPLDRSDIYSGDQ
jgi:hypothetical protein